MRIFNKMEPSETPQRSAVKRRFNEGDGDETTIKKASLVEDYSDSADDDIQVITLSDADADVENEKKSEKNNEKSAPFENVKTEPEEKNEDGGEKAVQEKVKSEKNHDGYLGHVSSSKGTFDRTIPNDYENSIKEIKEEIKTDATEEFGNGNAAESEEKVQFGDCEKTGEKVEGREQGGDSEELGGGTEVERNDEEGSYEEESEDGDAKEIIEDVTNMEEEETKKFENYEDYEKENGYVGDGEEYASSEEEEEDEADDNVSVIEKDEDSYESCSTCSSEHEPDDIDNVKMQ